MSALRAAAEVALGGVTALAGVAVASQVYGDSDARDSSGGVERVLSGLDPEVVEHRHCLEGGRPSCSRDSPGPVRSSTCPLRFPEVYGRSREQFERIGEMLRERETEGGESR